MKIESVIKNVPEIFDITLMILGLIFILPFVFTIKFFRFINE